MKDETKEILNKLLEYFKESNINNFGYEQDKLISYEEAQILLNYITNLQEENKKLKKEPYELKRHIKKINRRIRYLERELENKKEYIKELEDIEDNRVIILLRHIKEDEILDFHYSCARTQNNGKFEDSLTYNIYVKRKYNDSKSEGEENVKD